MRDLREIEAGREVHEGKTMSGRRGLFDNSGVLVWPLDRDETAEEAVRKANFGWKLIEGPK